jgi:hypothetical protein
MIGTLWRHTPKAIKKVGAPADRIFAVVEVDGKHLVAWKCTELPSGKISHPAFARPLDRTDKRLFVKKARNGADPTAMFKPDSFYKQL